MVSKVKFNVVKKNQKVGVVSIQGDFQKHIEALRSCGLGEEQIVRVRLPEDLLQVERLIIPGGESTTVGSLMKRFGLGEAIQEAAKKGMPIWGTCMGLILLAKEVENAPPPTLGLLDITVRRNAYGSQVHSFEEEVFFEPLQDAILGVFIRAPIVTRLGEGVEELARYEDKIVAVRQGNILATSFHPELTSDKRVHEWFLKM
jgi:5'-phosphate synthase pdxT subunit